MTVLGAWENGQRIYPKPNANKITATVQECESLLLHKPEDKAIERQLCLGCYLLARGSEAIPRCINGRAKRSSVAETVLGGVYFAAFNQGEARYQERALY